MKSEKSLRQLLKKANTQELLAICEICLNIVSSIITLTKRQRKQLLPYADYVRRISRIKTERGARKFIIQKGTGAGTHFFAALLAPILTRILFDGE
jgi:hypothetical protein